MFNFSCPVCNASINARPEFEGKALRCPTCSERVKVPAPATPRPKPKAPAPVVIERRPPLAVFLAGGFILVCILVALASVVVAAKGRKTSTATTTATSTPVEAPASKVIPEGPKQTPAKPVAEEIVTTGEVWDDYANVLNAKNIYEDGTRYIVIGTVVSVSRSLGKVVVVIAGGDTGLKQIRVYLPKKFEVEAAKLVPGQVIDFYGRISGSGQFTIRMEATDMGTGPEFMGRFTIRNR